MSLRTRVTGLAAVCVGTAVALVSLAGYFTVRTSLYDQLDTTLLQRADSLRSTLANAEQLGGIPASFFSAADIRVGLLDGRTGQSVVGGDLELGPQELAVARGEQSESLRTDKARDLRVAAVTAGPDAALVVASGLDTTRITLSRLGLVFILVGGAGVLLAAAAGTAVAQGGFQHRFHLGVLARGSRNQEKIVTFRAGKELQEIRLGHQQAALENAIT